MHIPAHAPTDAALQKQQDRLRIRRAYRWSALATLLLLSLQALLVNVDIHPFTVQPWRLEGLLGIVFAPLLHGSWNHVLSNSIAVLLLGTLAGSVYPRATVRALPWLWLGSGVGAWLLGAPGEHHLGASGITHGLMFLVFVLGLLRRDRAAVAAAMIAFLVYGGMMMTIFPQEAGVSWQSHLGGAVAGLISALALRTADPLPPRRVYSWELEEDAEQGDSAEP